MKNYQFEKLNQKVLRFSEYFLRKHETLDAFQMSYTHICYRGSAKNLFFFFNCHVFLLYYKIHSRF